MSLIRTNWNVVAAVKHGHFETAKWHLDRLGGIPGETGHPDVLVATVRDVDAWLATLRRKWREGGSMFDDFEYIRPVRAKISFDSEAEFYDRAGGLAMECASKIQGRRLAIDAEARGFEASGAGDRICRILRKVLTDQLDVTVAEDPEALEVGDVLIDLEVVEGTAGVGVWTTEERERYPFLGFATGAPRPRPTPTRPLRI